MFIVDLFKSRRRLEAENLFLRHQLSITAPASRRSGAGNRERGQGGQRLIGACVLCALEAGGQQMPTRSGAADEPPTTNINQLIDIPFRED
jgi:hypothetical protein